MWQGKHAEVRRPTRSSRSRFVRKVHGRYSVPCALFSTTCLGLTWVLGAMVKVRPRTILGVTSAIAVALAFVLVIPPAISWQAERTYKRSFVLADPTTQMHIVRSYLAHLEPRVPWCSSITVPVPLQELLQSSVGTLTHNPDPQVPNTIYAASPEDRPDLRTPGSCDRSPNIRLVKMSRAAIDLTTEQAISYVQTFYCGGEPGMRVIRFVKSETGWQVAQDHGNGARKVGRCPGPSPAGSVAALGGRQPRRVLDVQG